MLVCVADATNLRLVLRLILELKQVGRPLVLALNMNDIARRRGIGSTSTGCRPSSAADGHPIAVRRGGIEDLLRRMDELAGAAGAVRAPAPGHRRRAADLRAAQREAERIIKAAVGAAERPGHADRAGRRRAAASGRRPASILLGLLFVMFQAVFAWAAPLMDLIDAGFECARRAGAGRAARRPAQGFILTA